MLLCFIFRLVFWKGFSPWYLFLLSGRCYCLITGNDSLCVRVCVCVCVCVCNRERERACSDHHPSVASGHGSAPWKNHDQLALERRLLWLCRPVWDWEWQSLPQWLHLKVVSAGGACWLYLCLDLSSSDTSCSVSSPWHRLWLVPVSSGNNPGQGLPIHQSPCQGPSCLF